MLCHSRGGLLMKLLLPCYPIFRMFFLRNFWITYLFSANIIIALVILNSFSVSMAYPEDTWLTSPQKVIYLTSHLPYLLTYFSNLHLHPELREVHHQPVNRPTAMMKT
uniref:Uncharacterized protein n=1 Tax=Opuntia streptacantha TaxID=393608 RepID=A0A7C9DM15_OPUST